MPQLGPFARAFVTVNRIFGGYTLAVGLVVLTASAWHLLRGTATRSQLYVGVLFGLGALLVGLVYLRAPLRRRRGEVGDDDSSPDR
jgi:hypothetical protein